MKKPVALERPHVSPGCDTDSTTCLKIKMKLKMKLSKKKKKASETGTGIKSAHLFLTILLHFLHILTHIFYMGPI